MTLRKALCRIGFHADIATSRGVNLYLECKKCHRRRVLRGEGWSPIDQGWLKTGQWTQYDGPPPPKARR